MYLSSLNCTFFGGGGCSFFLFKIFWKPNFYSNELRINYILEDNILKEKKNKAQAIGFQRKEGGWGWGMVVVVVAYYLMRHYMSKH